MSKFILNRRTFLRSSGLLVAAAPLAGCDLIDNTIATRGPVTDFMQGINALTYRTQRFLIGADSLATEFAATEIRQGSRANGTTDPQTPDYLALSANFFADYRLEVGGLVDKPKSYSLSELQAMPARSQITRHDCVEGWSCIAKWTGAPLSRILDDVGVQAKARFVVFHGFDTYDSLEGSVPFYGSIDLIDARHPQTILAYGMNDATLPVENGAPLRVRVERQLGYKMSKYIKRIELVESYAAFGKGRGGYWEDHGYEWYAGI
jgi:DMSO/TMAO reductase YedYZ molybdopterin-dependent catalytic subunit